MIWPLDKRDSCHYSEPVFIANPEGSQEDYGVLPLTRFDGRTGKTSLLVLDAQRITTVAEAKAGTRVPMDFHGVFFAS